LWTYSGRQLLSWTFASIAMVGGYFITNWLVLGYGFLVGLYEVPFDIMQVVVGGIIGGPVSRYLRSSLPALAPFTTTQARR
ncbi:MAG TPA: ECF transporter S component, partial [Candidatus Bathyarchaeia archaeon]|nr:ECF transporter S component [Candidatus Bathyarchaeia archaeon]